MEGEKRGKMEGEKGERGEREGKGGKMEGRGLTYHCN